LIDLGQTRIK